MPESLLTILKFLLMALLYLFFLRVLRAVWAEVASPRPAGLPTAGTSTGNRSTRGTSGSGKGTPRRLRVVDPPEQRGRAYELADEMTLGRAAGCHVKVDDSYASQLHARVFRKDGQILVEDLGSTNGTYLNGSKVSRAQPVKRGDRVKIGATVFEVDL